MTNKENFSQSIIESEIDIKDENPFVSTESPNFESSDSSDIEVIAICQNTNAHKKNNLLRPIYKRKRPRITDNSVNNIIHNDEKSAIKEEIIISDESDSAEDNKYDSDTLNGLKVNISPQERKQKQNESLSAIILNCPRCNKTEKVFRITMKSNCEACNVNMHYICNKCNCKYDSMPALYRHKKLQCQYIKSNIKKKPKLIKMSILKCNNCDLAKKMLNLPKIPISCSKCRHTMVYECVICSKSYTSYSGMYLHIRRYCQLKHGTYYCNDCAYGCTKENTLVRHLIQYHKEHFLNSNVSCSKCKKVIGDIEQLRKHEVLCGLPFCQCKFCNYRPKIFANIEKHLLSHHAEEVNKEGLNNVLIHVAQNSQPKEKTVAPITQIKLLDINHFKLLYCKKCNKTYEYFYNAGNCQFCNKAYLHECICCQKRYFTSISLHRHIRRTHTETKFKCCICNKGFPCVGDINAHQKICGVEQRYHCKICTFKTRYRQSLSSHIYKLHNSKRIAFKCPTCGIIYKTNRAMKRHIKIGCS